MSLPEREAPQKLDWVNPYEGTGEKMVEIMEVTLREEYAGLGLDYDNRPPLPDRLTKRERAQSNRMIRQTITPER